jgi:hypothetical protein
MRFRFFVVALSLAFLSAIAAPRANADRGRSRISVPSDGDHSSSALTRIAGHDDHGGASGSDNPGETEIQGTVSAIDCGSNTMTVATGSGDAAVAFDAFTTFKMHGSAATCSDIQVGDTVEVSGTLQGDASILAAKVSIEAPEAQEAEITGTVSSVDCGADTMIVSTDSGDVTVSFDSSTAFQKQGNAAACSDVQVGDTVEVSGTLQGDGSILAAKVSIESEDGGGGDAQESEISGTVSSIDCGADTMVVSTDSGDVTVSFDGSTAFSSKGSPASCGDIAAGDAVEVSGALQGDGRILASKVGFEAPEIEETEVSGTILSTDSGTQTFVLTTGSGNVTIDTDSNTVIQQDGDAKTFADLAAGMQVEVKGILQGDGSILAETVKIESGD